MSWITNVENSIGNFVKSEIAKIEGDAGKVEIALESAAQVALNATNALKNFAESPTGLEIQAVIETVVPASWVNGVLDFLPVLINDLGWAVNEFNKSPAQVVQDGLIKAVRASVNVKATNLAVLQAHLNTHFTTVQGNPMSIQASLSQSPTVYVGVTAAPDGTNEVSA